MRSRRVGPLPSRPKALETTAVCLLVVVTAVGFPARADAQVAATATLESRYVLRGLTLSGGGPDLQLGLAYDRPRGGYVGVSAIVGQTRSDGFQPLGYIGYFGWSRRLADDVVIDNGVSLSQITLFTRVPINYYGPPNGPTRVKRYDEPYNEIYASVSRDGLSARLSAAPDYMGLGNGALYLDLTRTFAPTPSIRAHIHLGAVTPLGGSDQPGADRERFDVGAGASWIFRHEELRFNATGVFPTLSYIPAYPHRTFQLVIGASHFF